MGRREVSLSQRGTIGRHQGAGNRGSGDNPVKTWDDPHVEINTWLKVCLDFWLKPD